MKKQNILVSKFDIIFCDPPFKDKNIGKLIELIFKKNLLEDEMVICMGAGSISNWIREIGNEST